MERKLVDNPRPPFQLWREAKEGGYTTVLTAGGAEIWACGECGVLYTPWGDGVDPRQRAADCCRQQYCGCGEKIERGWTAGKCWRCNETANRMARLDKAVEIGWHDGPVFDDARDRYWSCLEDFLDEHAEAMEDGDVEGLPDWLFPCHTKPFARLDAMDLLESYLTDECHEDAADQLVDLPGLQKFLNAWCADQTVQTWEPDYTRKINVVQLCKGASNETEGSAGPDRSDHPG